MNTHMTRWIGTLGCALALAPFAHAQVLTLDEALRLGEEHSPRLAAQRSAVAASTEQVGRAAELPDPRLRLGIENLPVTGDDRLRYNSDSMTMGTLGVMQEFPNSAKREARNLRSERQRDVEAAGLGAQQAVLARDIAASWMEVHYAERSRAALERLARQFQIQVETLTAGVARGRQTPAEAFMARTALEQTNDRIIEQDRAVEKARIMLAALIGDEARRPLSEAPDTTQFTHPREHLVARLTEHPQLRVFEQREALARAEVALARSSAKADWALEVGYGYRKPAFDNMLTVMVSMDLPWQKDRRQDRDIASRAAEVDQARANREDARRMHEAEVRGWLADFDTAQRRIERFRRVLAPLARERVAAALAAYQGGRGEVGPVVEAERAITETDLGMIQALAERGRAWANLNYLYPKETKR